VSCRHAYHVPGVAHWGGLPLPPVLAFSTPPLHTHVALAAVDTTRQERCIGSAATQAPAEEPHRSFRKVRSPRGQATTNQRRCMHAPNHVSPTMVKQDLPREAASFNGAQPVKRVAGKKQYLNPRPAGARERVHSAHGICLAATQWRRGLEPRATSSPVRAVKQPRGPGQPTSRADRATDHTGRATSPPLWAMNESHQVRAGDSRHTCLVSRGTGPKLPPPPGADAKYIQADPLPLPVCLSVRHVLPVRHVRLVCLASLGPSQNITGARCRRPYQSVLVTKEGESAAAPRKRDASQSDNNISQCRGGPQFFITWQRLAITRAGVEAGGGVGVIQRSRAGGRPPAPTRNLCLRPGRWWEG
jgi:hypothetical protein